MGAKCGAGTVFLPVHLSSPPVLMGFVLPYLNISVKYLFVILSVFFDHCVVSPSLICDFLITHLVSFGHCIVSPSLICDFFITPLVTFGHCVVSPSFNDQKIPKG
jgi:hypothetical protein